MSDADLRIHVGVVRGDPVRFRFDGRELDAFAGESLAAALWASGIRGWSTTGTGGPPARTVFCAMGVCQQCAVWIGGVRVEACNTSVLAGLDVRTRA
ncbi:MAG: (2Fe-2S)-binding protein [Casimicrobiaceae bacterium]